MKRKETFIMPWCHPSLNKWAKWYYKKCNVEKQRLSDDVFWCCKHIDPFPGKVSVTVTTQFKTRVRRDIDNFVPKFILDGIVNAGIIQDDNCNCIVELKLYLEIGADEDQTIITITDAEIY